MSVAHAITDLENKGIALHTNVETTELSSDDHHTTVRTNVGNFEANAIFWLSDANRIQI